MKVLSFASLLPLGKMDVSSFARWLMAVNGSPIMQVLGVYYNVKSSNQLTNQLKHEFDSN